MKTFASGLLAIAEGKVSIVDISHADQIDAAASDLVIFDDRIGQDGGALVGRWKTSGVDIAVLIHSPLLQMDVSNELDDTMALLQSRTVSLILAADEALPPVFAGIPGCPPAVWMPHCLPPSAIRRRPGRRSAPDGRAVCWLPLTLRDDTPHYRHKNAVCQLAAAASCGLPVSVMTNTASPRLRQLARWLSLPMQEMGHICEGDFDLFLDGVSVGMCVSLSESFCYNAIEMMMRGVPVLFGPAVRWAWGYPGLADLCGVADPGSVAEIAGKLRRLLSDPEAYDSAVSAGHAVAAETIGRNHQAARRLISRLSHLRGVSNGGRHA